MGIQTLSILVSGDPKVLCSNCYDSEGLMLPLELTPAAATSRLLGLETEGGPGEMPSNIRGWVVGDNVTTNLHHDGVLPASFADNAGLKASLYNASQCRETMYTGTDKCKCFHTET